MRKVFAYAVPPDSAIAAASASVNRRSFPFISGSFGSIAPRGSVGKGHRAFHQANEERCAERKDAVVW